MNLNCVIHGDSIFSEKYAESKTDDYQDYPREALFVGRKLPDKYKKAKS